MPLLTLTNGMQAIVDEEDFDDLAQHTWSAQWGIDSFYAVRWVGPRTKRIAIYMSRYLVGLEPGDPLQAHHVNFNTLDNRKENLEIVTVRVNNENRRNRSKWGSGVGRYNNSNKFVSYTQHEGKRVVFGPFNTPEEAQEARQEFIKCHTL